MSSLLQLCIEYNGLYIYDESQPPPHPIIQHLKAFGVSQVVKLTRFSIHCLINFLSLVVL